MADNAAVHAEDVLPVRSRVSWGAIFAGAMVALALYFLLTLLGGAIGLSAGGQVRAETLGTGAAVWAVLTTVLALFAGGYVTSQCSVGENRFEAVLYGVILWGVLFGMLLWLMATGVRAGFTAMVGMSQVTQAVGEVAPRNWEEDAQRDGVSKDQIAEWRKSAPDAAEKARLAAKDEDNRRAAQEAATRVTWWAFFGTLVSMLASVGGAYFGAGPSFRLLSTPYLRVRGTAQHRTVGAGY